jgi:hypothetical protein
MQEPLQRHRRELGLVHQVSTHDFSPDRPVARFQRTLRDRGFFFVAPIELTQCTLGVKTWSGHKEMDGKQ